MGAYTLEDIVFWVEYGLRESDLFRWENITLNGIGRLKDYLNDRGYCAIIESTPIGNMGSELKYDLVVKRVKT